METSAFLEKYQVFTLEQAERDLAPNRGKGTALKRVQYLQGKGRVRSITHRVYATIPVTAERETFQPDRYLVAAAARPDAVFAYHAALELLGAAHSDWNVCAVLTRRRRPPIPLGGITIHFLRPPAPLERKRKVEIGIRTVNRRGSTLRVTGPERTLVDGFRQSRLAGGVSELIESAAGFGVLDLPLLKEILEAYDEKLLWSAVGWFLERFERTFFVPPEYQNELERHRPKGPRYLLRSERGGVLSKRWNLIVPDYIQQGAEPDEP